MTDIQSTPRPAWQTDELEDEWIEDDDDDEHNREDHENTLSSLSQGTRSISMTTPLAGVLHVISSADDTDSSEDPTATTTDQVGGTFLVRQDVPAAPLLPQTPGRNNKKGAIKDFFSPLPLERMFEPPSPPSPSTQPQVPTQKLMPNQPAVPSRLAREYIPDNSVQSDDTQADRTNMPTMAPFANNNHQFTFTVPRQTSNTQSPQAQSTPTPRVSGAGVPMTDPRLKLFQFQYDTFTRDHLSAIVDSIAVNPPSGGTEKSNKSSPYASARSLDSRVNPTDNTHLRSAKRVKLSREPDYGYGEGDGEGASVARPKLSGKDYVRESRKMMEQIKSARDFSTVSTTSAMEKGPASQEDGDGNDKGQARPAIHRFPSTDKKPPTTPFRPPIPPLNSTTSRLEKYSSLAYRKQAAELMEQIKSDMKGSKRIFSGDTDLRDGDKENEQLGPRDRKAPNRAPFLTPTAPRASRHIPTYTQRSNTKGHSPRKLSRKPSVANEVDRELADGAADMSIEDHEGVGAAPALTIPAVNRAVSGSIRVPRSRSPVGATPSRLPALTQQPGFLVLPTYPINSVRLGANADLNRFVSSSTATSGTALTVGSAGSFVKHAGPGQVTGSGSGNGNIRRIAPEDVQGLGERVGRMVYDRVMMRWVKGVAGRVGDGDGEGREEERTENTRASTESEDVFRDIESLRDTDGDTELQPSQEEERMSRITETDREKDDEEADDEEEMGLTSFSFDGPSTAGVVQVMTGVDDMTTDSEDEDDCALVTEAGGNEYNVEDAFDSDEELPDNMLPPPVASAFSTPRPPTQLPPQTPVVRSVLKSTSNTPVSALKNGTGPRTHRTPANRISHRRSVSFSDGKREGPIRGVGKDVGGVMGDEVRDDKGAVFVPSVRSKRIADMMEDLENQADFEEDDSPTRTSNSGRKSSEELQPLAVRRPSTYDDNGQISRRIFSRSQTHRMSPHNKANATFLTECSFAVSHDRLVQVITDVKPFEPHWEKIRSINLSKKNVESVARLKEFLPKLDSLNLNSNQLSWLSGIPGNVRTLSVSSNFLTGITSFNHLLNLENLDISDNDVDSLRQLECLRHLRELRADGNKITSIDGLQGMDGLVKLSLHENGIRDIDLTKFRWSRLEMLNLSRNRIDNIEGLTSLPSLIALNLDDNSLGDLEPSKSMPKLRILRLSGNRLYRLNVAPFPNLRTLYADNNSITDLAKTVCLSKLENLSLRNQSGREFHLSTREIRDVKRLYLSGNALRTGFIEESCYNLVYLELAACRLSTLPADLASLTPNLRVLNLNYNFIEDARPLEGLSRLKKLTLIGSRLKGTKALIRILMGMPNVEMLDFRMNPCTLGWYLPLLVKDVPGALQPSEGGDKGEDQEPRGRKKTDFAWKELDSKFRRDLPDEVYIGRLAYRGLVMRACPQIRMLDGVDVSDKERAKALHLLQGISSKRKVAGRRGG